MKILKEANRDSVLAQRAQARNRYDTWKADYNDRYKKYETDYKATIAPIKDSLTSELNSRCPSLHFDVKVDIENWGGTNSIIIRCTNCSAFGSAIGGGWDFHVYKKGNEAAVFNTTSGSLNIENNNDVTSVQETAEALRYLVSVDWDELFEITQQLPDQKNYFSGMADNPGYKVDDYNSQLRDATLSDLVGQDEALLVEAWPACPFRGYAFIKVLRDTGSQVAIEVAAAGVNGDRPESEVQADFAQGRTSDMRVRKSTLVFDVEDPTIINL